MPTTTLDQAEIDPQLLQELDAIPPDNVGYEPIAIAEGSAIPSGSIAIEGLYSNLRRRQAAIPTGHLIMQRAMPQFNHQY